MIKLVVFDLDGVLVDARELHYEALNEALADAQCGEEAKEAEDHLGY